MNEIKYVLYVCKLRSERHTPDMIIKFVSAPIKSKWKKQFKDKETKFPRKVEKGHEQTKYMRSI